MKPLIKDPLRKGQSPNYSIVVLSYSISSFLTSNKSQWRTKWSIPKYQISQYCYYWQTEKILYDRNLDKEYAGMMGFDTFCREAYKLAFGEDHLYKDNLVSSDFQSRLLHNFIVSLWPTVSCYSIVK